MKKLNLLLITLFISVIGIYNVCAVDFDTSKKIYDYANLLTTEEEDSLRELALNYIEIYNMDIAMVTVNHHNKLNSDVYAQDFYDYNGFGIGKTRDGIILVIDFSSGYREFAISTTGNAIKIYDDERIDSILDSIQIDINNDTDNYYQFFKTFIDKTSNFASAGVPNSNKHMIIDKNGDPFIIPWAGIFIFSFIVPTIVLIIFICKNKMVKKATNANEYIKDYKITNRVDKFVTTHTTSIRLPDSSGSSSGRVGGSSISRGSSGISHGGGSRRM